MATLREIKGRIVSIKSTEKITRAMKMVAAVKFRKANESVLASRPYSKGIDRMLRMLLPSVTEIDNELIKGREVQRIALVVVAGDRGLAGSFNTNLLKSAQNIINNELRDYQANHNLSIISVGRKSHDYFFKRGYDMYASYSGVFDSFDFNTARKIVDDILSGFHTKKFDKVIAVYNEFKNVIQSKIISEQLIPLKGLETAAENKETKNKVTDYIYEPGQKDIINYLLPKQLNTHMWQIMLESYASEQAARMTAMESATTNANELLGELNLLYNRERQAAITKELLEVISGANALKEG
jgi:F-type H+-transporting ATPase subunit gamma